MGGLPASDLLLLSLSLALWLAAAANLRPAVPLQQGYPRPPLYVKDGQLRDAWRQELVTLRGLSWFGFNNQQGQQRTRSCLKQE